MNDALTQFAQEDIGFQQYTERYEEISDDMRVRRMYNIWTEDMSALDQARTEGRDEGRTEGLTEGRIEGRIEGRTETLFDVAVAALKQGLSIDLISSLTSLPVEKIEEIKSSL